MKDIAIQRINQVHSLDPKKEVFEGNEYPAELLYANRCVDWLYKLTDKPSKTQELAARCQHFKRWKIARNSFPLDRKGYHQWRIELYSYQADEACKILAEIGYADEELSEIHSMISKENIRSNVNSQLIEDVACLVFLEHYLTPFSQEKSDYSEEKWLTIIRKTWNKMSVDAQNLALEITFEENLKKLILQAIS